MTGAPSARRPDAPPRRRALVALNPAARQASAGDRFEALRASLESALELTVVHTTADRAWESAVREALADGVRVFVAAGGDGTVHALVGAVLRARPADPLDDVVIGAIGLGSSDDFHKPTPKGAGPATRLDVEGAQGRRVLRIVWEDGSGAEHDDVVVVSASIGVTAAGNARFNDPGPALAMLQRISVGLAIVWAALATVLAWRDVRGRITVDAHRDEVGITNLSVLLTPWLSGGLRYDLPVDPASGRFVVALAHDRGLLARLWLLAGLARGRFAGRPGTRWWSAMRLDVALDAPAALELDGEVVQARAVRVRVHPHPLRICGPGGPHG